MQQQPINFLQALEPYQGIPYRHQGSDRYGCDCIGLVKLVWGEVLGVDLTPYDVPHRSDNPPARALVRGLNEAFGRPAGVIKDQSVLVFRHSLGAPQHCAIATIDGSGEVYTLHADRAAGEVLLRAYRPSLGNCLYGVWAGKSGPLDAR